MISSLDAHAHLGLDVTRGDLDALGTTGIMAVTRTPEEWPGVLGRRDSRVVWGIGCHPGVLRGLRMYNEALFTAVAKKAVFVGEVGLDGRPPTPDDLQRQVFRSILRIATDEGLILSVHSLGRTIEVLDEIEATDAKRVILHWWTGQAGETQRAIKLGCYFSVNSAAHPHILAELPRDRVLTETDFPLTATIDPPVARPGGVDAILATLAQLWGCDANAVRASSWRAIGELDRGSRRLERANTSFAGAMASLR